MKRCVYCDEPLSMWGFDQPCPKSENGQHRSDVAPDIATAVGSVVSWTGQLSVPIHGRRPRLSVVEGGCHFTPRRRGLHLVE